MRIVGFIANVFAIIMIMYIASEGRLLDMTTFIDGPTVFYFVLTIGGAVVSTGGFKTLVSGINGIFSRKYQMTDEQREKSVELFKFLGKVTALASIVLMFSGVILLMLNLNDPSTMGTHVGVALMAVFWGAAIEMLFIQPAVYMLNQKREPEPARAARIKDKEALEKLAQLCFEKGLTYEDIMEADDIQLRKYQ
jgi:flagellar motor component MotA